MASKSQKRCNCVCHRASATGLNLCDKCKDWFKKNKGRKTTHRRQQRKKTTRPRQPKRRKRQSKGKSLVPVKNPYSRNIYSVLKCIFPDLSISRMGMNVMNSFFMDLLDRIASEASTLIYLSQKATMGYNDIISATKLVIKSPELCELAIDAAKVTVDWTENH